MAGFKDRFVRVMRSNLNDLLDRIREFEDRGGFDKLFEEFIADGSFEQLGGGSGPGGASSRGGSDKKTIREYYANLEVPYGSDLETVRKSYHRLMRRYHPDRYAHDPEMEELATELSQEITRAYTAVRAYLKHGR